MTAEEHLFAALGAVVKRTERRILEDPIQRKALIDAVITEFERRHPQGKAPAEYSYYLRVFFEGMSARTETIDCFHCF